MGVLVRRSAHQANEREARIDVIADRFSGEIMEQPCKSSRPVLGINMEIEFDGVFVTIRLM